MKYDRLEKIDSKGRKMSNKVRPRDFTRRDEIQEYAWVLDISFREAVVDLVNEALSHGALHRAYRS